jgi:tRNA threonylcarbamoyladenosine biosynthesis protein TsaB
VKILAADTALGALSVALLEDGKVLAEEWRAMERGHAEALAPMVDGLMRRAGVTFPMLDRLAVTTGPGTFTGQRVGLAFMRALALALKKPLIGITSLDAMAAEALMAHPGAMLGLAAADAKRGEIYLGARTRDAGLLEPVLVALGDASVMLAPLMERFGSAAICAGTATPLLLPLLSGVTDSAIRQPHARFVALLSSDAAIGPPPSPLYLRAPDARLPAPP